MLAIYRPKFIEKILTDGLGRRFRVVFAVSYAKEGVRGRIVSAEEIKSLKGEIAPTVCISGYCSDKKIAEAVVSPYAPTVTPFYTLEFLINSQPTRAPSHK